MPTSAPQQEEQQSAGKQRNKLERRLALPAHGALKRALLPCLFYQREIVGETLSRHTEPVKLVKSRAGSILELRVAGPAAAIVQHQAPEILARASMKLGEGEVTKLRIVQGPIRGTGQASRPKPARKRSRPPLDAAAERALAEGLAAQPDGPLKAALEKLGREVLRPR